jgi:hypothetical protein
MTQLRRDPLPALLGADNAALVCTVRRDLLGERPAAVTALWDSPEAVRIVAKQRHDGGWTYPGGNPRIRTAADYDQLETFRQLGVLVGKYGMTREHPAVTGAAAFLSSFQADAGDYRGIYGRQHTPNYSAAITELLILAGFEGTPQVERAMTWLTSARQDDGGWAIPARTLAMPLTAMLAARDVVEPDRSRPSSHLITGIVLRALAAHSQYRQSAAALRAGDLLKSRFLRRDAYPDRAAPSFWLVFSYPFWWTDLLSALDSLSRIGFLAGDQDIDRGVEWFIENQEPNGLWNTGRNRPKRPDSDLWVGLAICRMLRMVG